MTVKLRKCDGPNARSNGRARHVIRRCCEGPPQLPPATAVEAHWGGVGRRNDETKRLPGDMPLSQLIVCEQWGELLSHCPAVSRTSRPARTRCSGILPVAADDNGSLRRRRQIGHCGRRQGFLSYCHGIVPGNRTTAQSLSAKSSESERGSRYSRSCFSAARCPGLQSCFQ